MYDWLGVGPLLLSLAKVLLVLASFQGIGSACRRLRIIRSMFPTMPSLVFGMATHVLLTAVLSLLGLLTRNLLPLLLIPGAVYCVFRLAARICRLRVSLPRPHLVYLLLLAMTVYAVSVDLLDAGRPEMRESDPLITYAVQPDRWLDQGGMYFLDEMVFSAYPMVGEMLAVWPASMAADMLDQLILIQLYQALLMLAATIAALRLLKVDHRMYLPVIFAVAACNLIADHATMAKIDMTALFFLTVALSIQARRVLNSEEAPDLSPYLAFGLALSTKLTAAPGLIPLAILLLLNGADRKPGRILRGLSVMLVFPVAFALRTAWHTGSPFYPHGIVDFLVKPRWKMPDLHPALAMRLDRTSAYHAQPGLLRGILAIPRSWELTLLLPLCGICAHLVSRGKKLALRATAVILGYWAAATVFFWPPWWGYKYTVIILPFFAALGGRLLGRFRRLSIAVSIVSVGLFLLLTSRPGYNLASRSIPHGPDLLMSFASGRWTCQDYPALYFPPNAPLQLWARNKLPEGSTVVSPFVPTRYFSGHRTICAWRHPYTREIFADNDLREEVDILQRAGTDYVSFVREDPMPMDIERDLQILGHIGTGDVLEPMMKLNGFLLCSFNPQKGHYSSHGILQDSIPVAGYDHFTAGHGEHALELVNGLSGLGIRSMQAVTTDSADTLDLLQGSVIFPGEGLTWRAAGGTWHILLEDQSGVSYRLDSISVPDGPARHVISDDYISEPIPSVALGTGQYVLGVRNNLPFADITRITVYTGTRPYESDSLMETDLHLGAREMVVLSLKDLQCHIEVQDSDGYVYSRTLSATVEEQHTWFVIPEDMELDFGF